MPPTPTQLQKESFYTIPSIRIEEVLSMYVKKTITLPQELEKEVQDLLIGKYYANLSDVIRDGIRRVLKDYELNREINAVARLYEEDKITIREASDITGIPLRSVLGEFGKKGVYIRYDEDDLKEDIE
jgi:Arc/MetJ-type ribon-helix-helix transcriptional regulator